MYEENLAQCPHLLHGGAVRENWHRAQKAPVAMLQRPNRALLVELDRHDRVMWHLASMPGNTATDVKGPTTG